MTKKSQRRAVRYEKDKSGCMWGFISMFDFRHGHSTRKLIADKRQSSKYAVGSVHSKNRFEVLNTVDEVSQRTFDSGESKRTTVRTSANKPSVKKLIEEEMFTDQNAMKGIDNAETESKESRQRREVLLKLDSKRKKKLYEKNRAVTDELNLNATLKSETLLHQHSRKQSKDNLDLDKIIEEFCHLKGAYSMMPGNDGNVEQNHVISEIEKKRDTIREFVNQMIMNGKDLEEAKKLLCSHELMEALQLTSSDKELFLAFLQNPNSVVLKCVQNSENSQRVNDKDHSCVTGSNFSEQDHDNLEQTKEIVNHKKHKFFRKKVKSHSKSLTNENGNTGISNKIVILKPGPSESENSETENNLASYLDSRNNISYNGSSVRGGSHFSLTEIKKKLKHAMGKERHGSLEGISRKYPTESQNKGPRNKVIGKDNVGMRSPNKDHFFIEKIARPLTGVMKGDNKGGTNKDFESIVENEKSIYPKQGVSDLYIEAKKHLSEMVGNGDENKDLSSKQFSKTLGRILSLPDYNFSPLGSPGRDFEHHFVTAKRRFSTSDVIWEANKDNLSPKRAAFLGPLDKGSDSSEKKFSICDESSNNKVHEIKLDSNFSDGVSRGDKEENYCHAGIEIVTEGDGESSKEITILESSSETVILSAGKKDQNFDISEIPDSAICSQCLKQDLIEENQSSSPFSSPSHSSITTKTKELESVTDVSGRPSPVSVLDTPFLENDISSGLSRCQPAEIPIRPLHVQFEEQGFSHDNQIKRAKYCIEENELIYDYIEAVLQASGLTRDQLFVKCLSSDKILDPSSFDQVEFFPNRLCRDQKLLYDCINDVLMEVSCDYFGASPFVSFVNPGIRPTPNMKGVTLNVWEGVCWHFLPLPPPQTLDKIIGKDMDKSKTWMDLRFEAETVGFEISNVILSELMEDTILSFVSRSPESESPQLQCESKDNKNSINV